MARAWQARGTDPRRVETDSAARKAPATGERRCRPGPPQPHTAETLRREGFADKNKSDFAHGQSPFKMAADTAGLHERHGTGRRDKDGSVAWSILLILNQCRPGNHELSARKVGCRWADCEQITRALRFHFLRSRIQKRFLFGVTARNGNPRTNPILAGWA